MAMNTCVVCGGEVGVVNSRPTKEGHIYRRYRCVSGHKFSTTESVQGVDDREAELRLLQAAVAEMNMVVKRLKRSAVRYKVQRVPESEAA